MKALLRLRVYIHHVKEHETGVLVFVFFVKLDEIVFLIKRNCRKVGIHREVAKGRASLLLLKKALYLRHQHRADVLSAIVKRYSKTPNLYGRVTAELLALRKAVSDFLPAAIGNVFSTDFVIQETEIGSNSSVVFKNESISNTQFLRGLSVLKQELVQIFISTIKSGQLVVCGKWNEFHRSPAHFNQFVCFSKLLSELPMYFLRFFLTPIFHHQPTHLKVECVLPLQYGCFSNWSCHNITSYSKKCPALVRYIPFGREAVAGSIGCKDTTFYLNSQRFFRKSA